MFSVNKILSFAWRFTKLTSNLEICGYLKPYASHCYFLKGSEFTFGPHLFFVFLHCVYSYVCLSLSFTFVCTPYYLLLFPFTLLLFCLILPLLLPFALLLFLPLHRYRYWFILCCYFHYKKSQIFKRFNKTKMLTLTSVERGCSFWLKAWGIKDTCFFFVCLTKVTFLPSVMLYILVKKDEQKMSIKTSMV